MVKKWADVLHDAPLPWLLEPENPSVRFWTLTNLLDRPAVDPEVVETRAAIAQQPWVQELFARQHPRGHWGDDETKPYTAQGAVGVLSILHMLGLEPDGRTAAGCDSCLRFGQHESGGFSRAGTRRICGSVSRTWPLEKRNRPSKWVTLDALRLLQAVAREE